MQVQILPTKKQCIKYEALSQIKVSNMYEIVIVKISSTWANYNTEAQHTY